MFYSKNAQLTALIGTLIQQSEKFGKFTALKEAELHLKAETIKKVTADRAANITEPVARKSMLALSKRADQKMINQARRDMQTAAQDDIAKHFEFFSTWAGNLETTRELNASPRMMACRAGLGTEERARLESTLHGCGSQELLAYSKLFLAEGNGIGAAVVLAEAGRNSKRHSQFDAAQYAEQAVGSEFKDTKALLDEASLLLDGLGDQRTTFQRDGKILPDMRIRSGLHSRQVEKSKGLMAERGKAQALKAELEAGASL